MHKSRSQEGVMLVGVRKKHWLLATLSVTGLLLVLVFTTKSPGHSPTRALLDPSEERKAAQTDGVAAAEDLPAAAESAVHTKPPLHLSEQERDALAKQGVLMVEDSDRDPMEDQTQKQQQQKQHRYLQHEHSQLRKSVPANEAQEQEIDKLKLEQQQELHRENNHLQEHHMREQQILQDHILADEMKAQQAEEQRMMEEAARLNPPPAQSRTSSVSVVSRTYKVNRGMTAASNGGSSRGVVLPRMTYEGLWKMGENILRHTIKKEFLNSIPDTDFTPGEVVPPLQVRRVIILSTWRSGSSFLGDLLKSYPGTYFSFEPLHHLLKNLHLQEGPLVDVVLNLLRSIMTCDLSQQEEYVSYMRNNSFLMDHNTRVWNSCSRNRALCFDKEYLSAVCKYMPVNVMKTVRMGLVPVISLLQDPSLDLQVIHLVRDPRGSLHSRMQLTWCHSQACSDPGTVCGDLMTDLKLSEWVKERFPDKYLLVRYEDLGLQPEETARRIFKFLHLTYHKNVASFVRDHTSINRKTKKKPGTYSTYRDSKSTTFAWRGALNYTTLEEIQNACREPLSYLKLRIFDTEEDFMNATIPVLVE
ncbi:carbohydrate sulfotransferase 4-like isoform X1 [Penaeus chinensis]|uniref:carbohydrate sulfotransferase 4-like isoform X1 n=2 Tax=Penaeus chinensis TaxID=139456 RepID=UPI001FB81C2D|nr:carbohydrate sulfotransferase 4-like isoform X1 [Penaeus chinensis]